MIRAGIIAAAMAGLGAIIVVTAAASSSTFDGSPPTPLGYQQGTFMDGWSVNVHERSMAFSGAGQALGDSIHPLNAQHGADCAGPPATHTTGSSRSAAVFQCRDHIMTALNGTEYGVIYLMPGEQADFSTQAVIQWDMSSEKMSARDWWDVTISPLLESQSLPLLSDLSQGVDLQGPNRNAVFIGTDNAEGAPHLKIVRNGQVEDYGPPSWAGHRLSDGIAAGTNQAATRQTMRFTLTRTSAKLERLSSATASAMTFFDASFAPLAWTQGAVQWGHHSYTPEKDNAGDPATWHWDTFSIDPAVPFYLKHYPRYIGNGGGTLVTDPAPANAYLRFSAVCRIAVDGFIAPKMVYAGNPINASSYLVPIAEGTTAHAISFSADDWYFHGCNAKDFDVVSLGGAPSPTATTSPAPTPTVTQSPSPTATSLPTPTPTVVPTPDVRRYRCQVRQGASWVTVWDGANAGRSCP